jgi:hypothetical protein
VGVRVGAGVAVGEGVAACSTVGVWLVVGVTAVLQAERSAAARRRINNLFIMTRVNGMQRIKGRL